MRLFKTSLTAVALIAATGTAFAATTTRDTVTVTMKGTSRVASGGTLNLIVSRKPNGKKFGITIRYDVRIKSHTVLGFAAYPCKSTSCVGQSTGKIDLPSARVHHVTFTGRIPVVKTGNKACVFAQVRDLGPKGKDPGTIIRRGHGKGVRFCRTV
jgi:hypothetical protein